MLKDFLKVTSSKPILFVLLSLFVTIAILYTSCLGFAKRSEVSQISHIGDPLDGLTKEQLSKFNVGRDQFLTVEAIADGLGPAFNEKGCATCHNLGAIGGAGTQREVRAGILKNNGTFDSLENKGGSLFQIFGIGLIDISCSFTGENVPDNANVIALRRTIPLFGLGLVDATADSTFLNIAANQAPSVRGNVSMVTNISAGTQTVGKFGWKAQNPTLFQFSGDAYLNEMGITTPQFPNENLPQGNPAILKKCDNVPDPEDDGEDVQLFTDFMQLLAPPPRGDITPQVKAGDTLFTKYGCDQCHVRSITTESNPVQALSNKTYHPYSDFLLHDMGALGDNIAQSDAGPSEIRTQPLWGIRYQVPLTLLHDGSALTINEAILAHAGQGAASSNAYKAANKEQQNALIAFLNSL